MSNLIQFLKENFKIIFSSILIYQFIITIFCFTTENLVILAIIIVIFSSYAIITSYKDDITSFFKK